ncbi:uncharacterized protein LOC127241153 isoform X2 [Andrographis paniculata]|uniref:uncharacterized protein LOC127241153 isoform X2 n=1 Tax=Andrographis paniculata TaxID=175694 RepID=UPI0021E7F281|nr:uncharacterized protein LOC127241153 isoform X2 [Andrographis paniculata]
MTTRSDLRRIPHPPTKTESCLRIAPALLSEIAWNEIRRKWVGNVSHRPERTMKDPIISWSTTYEELLSNHEPFPERIPLPEMVDFLVDIWQDEGLFD